MWTYNSVPLNSEFDPFVVDKLQRSSLPYDKDRCSICGRCRKRGVWVERGHVSA